MNTAPSTTCERCGKTAPTRFDGKLPPEGWEGTVSTGVCPGCQLVEWHPHCMALLDWETDKVVNPRVDWAGMPAEELDWNSVRFCEHIELSIAHIDDGSEWPLEWTCPRCGTHHTQQDSKPIEEGGNWDWVHRDYQQSGLEWAGFDVDIEGA
jgi:hypothetical protein